ncbi:SigB/SigF/SigG family RNA polymerase sigma factor [Streptomyces sp. MST-110588]|uniref:SigB/SigF/SigG family RNA polymerase sigma factor n=1 Tax=Streptomyces sp. MST-110588 TaxID=2833628 RepID=UPI001F5DAAB7|nr:SigB/SigF/SigG family RNA polymerase sigma factor [Streptomyces sp. MST-110588]UNO39300.1 SigB/SigF/SigG family RNA polymerase sigma factor [Streptomyces sp. MST-110588]
MTSKAAPNTARRRVHYDAPDTAEAFLRMASLPDGPEKQRLREQVTCAWLPMAQRLALRFRDRGESLEDLKQVAALGLVKAVDHFDPGRGDAFASYAVPTVVGEIKRHFRDHTWGVHVPRRVQELRAKVRTAVRELSATADDRSPSVAAIAAHTQLSEGDVLLGMEALQSYKSLSLEAERPGADDGLSLHGSLGLTEPAYELVTDREAVKTYVRRLPERERRILYLRFFCDMTQSRIGEELGLSQMHVCRIIRRTCATLREQVETQTQGETVLSGP